MQSHPQGELLFRVIVDGPVLAAGDCIISCPLFAKQMIYLIKTLVKTAPLIHRVPTAGGILKRIKYILRGLVHPRDTREWFELLQTPSFALIVRDHPCLFHKLQRPYLNRSLNTRQRLETLKEHYHFVIAIFSTAMMEEVYGTTGLILATMPLEGLGHFGLRLACSNKQKEGDLSIVLLNQHSGAELFTLSFSISRFGPDCKEISVGGLQGNRCSSKNLVVSITRRLHGLRPKALLFFALQQLAAEWEITRIRAVSNREHIYRHFQKRREFPASYDQFWLECGGHLAEDGMFDLPVTFAPREVSCIKINKRQLYRRRYEMLSDIADQIRLQVSRNGKMDSAFAPKASPEIIIETPGSGGCCVE